MRRSVNVIRNLVAIAMLGGVVSLQAVGAGQDKPAAPPPPAKQPIRVDVVLTRYDGDAAVKKTSSLPFTLWVNANDNRSTSVRMGIDVPVVVSNDGKSGIQYRNIGTSIDCRAETVDGGRYQLDLTIQDSAVYEPSPGARAGVPGGAASYSAFRQFSSNTRVIARDGQAVEFNMATDKISGEVLKVSVTAVAVK